MNVESRTSHTRIVSLDVFRGFVMFWIVGADALGEVFRSFSCGGLGPFLSQQLSHTVWEGLTFYDLIFPSFILALGISIPLSLDPLVERRGMVEAHRRILWRGLLMYLLGILYYGGLSKGFDQVRLLGVLQRLALCYVAGSYAHLKCRGLRLPILAGVLLVGYWALMMLVPVPGHGAGDLARDHNLANWIDQHYLPGRLWYGDYDPEGLLSTLPAIGSVLIGVMLGRAFMADASAASRARLLMVVGAALLAVGYLWGVPFPIIKRLWTSSYALVAAGWGALALASFSYLVDVRGLVSWSAPFQWIGANALFIYLVSHLLNFNELAGILVGGPIAAMLDHLSTGFGAFVQVAIGTLLCMLLCRFLFKNKIIIRL